MKLPFSTLPEGEKTERVLCIKIGTRACRTERKKQDKVNSADSAFILLIILSQKFGQGGEDGLVWSGLC